MDQILLDKIKDFFLALTVSILLYGCIIWTLSKCMEEKLEGNNTRMLHAALNKSWKHHPHKKQLYNHLPPISKTTQVDEEDMLGTAGEARMN